MSHLLRISCSFRTSLTILRRFPEYRTFQHLQLQERGCANTQLLVVSKALDEVKKRAKLTKKKRKKKEPKSKLDKAIEPLDTAQHKSGTRGNRSRIETTQPTAELTLLETLKNSNITIARDEPPKVPNINKTNWYKEYQRLYSKINKFAAISLKRKHVNEAETGSRYLTQLLNLLENLDMVEIVHTLTLKGKTKEAVAILYTYCDICNKLEDAQKPKQLYDINLYNCIHRGLAKEGKLIWMELVLTWMKDQAVSPTLQTYAHFLECLQRYPDRPLHCSKIEYIINQLQEEGLQVEELYRGCMYQSDEWTHVRKAVESVIPDFEPRPFPEKRPYNNPLLTHLDTPEVKQAKLLNPNHKIMSRKELLKKIDERFGLEKKKIVPFDPVVKLVDSVSEDKEKFDAVKEEWITHLTRYYDQLMSSKAKNQSRKGMSTEKKKERKIRVFLELVNKQDFAEMIAEVIEYMLQDSLKRQYWSQTRFAWNVSEQLMKLNNFFYLEKHGVKDKVGVLYQEYANILLDEKHLDGNHREIWESISNKHMDGPTLGIPMTKWSKETCVWVGHYLLEVTLKMLTISVEDKDVRKEESIFYQTERTESGRVRKYLLPHPYLLKLYRNKTKSVGFDISVLPSLIPPVPWTSVNFGINLLGGADCIRPMNTNDVDSHLKMIQAITSEDILSIFDVLNYLGSCPWTINKPLLDLQVEVFNKKGNKEMNIPMPSSSYPLPENLQNIHKCKFESTYPKLLVERYKWKKKSLEMDSLWYSCLWTLTIANQFQDEVFWLPLNMDFRGRVYACSSILQYQSNDMTRSLFLFANGKPLGEKGLDWLKIHLINLTELKKRHSNRDRLAYANEVMEDILDSADNPLDGRMWWLKGEAPWQTLACCKEIAAAVRSEDHTKFVSRFPVHQDGSCNGLQHYAALGRDQSGAMSVNMDHFDVPKDVYSDILEMVEAQRQKDAANGKEIAKIVAPYVTRKVVKRPIMTSVYGVTNFGAKNHVRQTLKELNFPEEHLEEASYYISTITMSNLKKRFQSARAIQDWFNLVSWTTSAHLKKHVEWKNPLGLHIVQFYSKNAKLKDPKSKRTRTVRIPNHIKQKNGFAPNYIHSLDSVHMMLTALHCMKENLTFSSVHDCFWTHACDIDSMNKICREQFVALHSQPLLKNLSDHMLEAHQEELKIHDDMNPARKQKLKEYAEMLKPTGIKQGEFDIKKVLESEYFFS